MTQVTVRPAAFSEQTIALRLLFTETDNPRELIKETLAAAKRGEVSLAGLLLAEIAGQLVGAGLFTEQPGRVGFAWPPGVPADQPFRSTIQDAILTAIARRLDELKLCFGQVILDPHDLANRKLLDRNGFPHLTDLHYMLCPADSAPPGELPPRFEAETYNAATNSERFAQSLERTYIYTLDCPELEGLRTAHEALAAHQATGRFDPNRWWLFRYQNCDAGLLLVNEHPERDLWEIVYVGVVSEARGQGLGRHMVHMAVREAHREQRSIVLAVDSRNHVARRIYHQCGFLDLSVQSVHLRKAATIDPIPQFTNYAQPTGTGKRNS